MALFQKKNDPVRTQRDLENKVEAKRVNRDSLSERLRAAEAAVISHRTKARELARDGGDDAAIATAEAAMRVQQDRVTTLTAALSDVEINIGELEAEITRLIDGVMRSETSAAVLEMASELEVLFGDFDNVARALQEADAWEAGSSLMSPDVGDVRSLVMKVREGLQNASVHALASLKSHAAAVLAGTARPSLPQRPAPAPHLEIVPPMPTVTLFATKKLKYLDAAGAVIVCGAYRQHAFPQALGELAIRTNVAVTLDDKRVRDHQAAGFATVGTPEESGCTWLGPKGRELPERFAKPGGPPIHSQFTPMDRGKPYVATFSRPPEPEALPLVGARKLDGETP